MILDPFRSHSSNRQNSKRAGDSQTTQNRNRLYRNQKLNFPTFETHIMSSIRWNSLHVSKHEMNDTPYVSNSIFTNSATVDETEPAAPLAVLPKTSSPIPRSAAIQSQQNSFQSGDFYTRRSNSAASNSSVATLDGRPALSWSTELTMKPLRHFLDVRYRSIEKLTICKNWM